jgi:adenosylcobinamide-phosphate guanylyltransferase
LDVLVMAGGKGTRLNMGEKPMAQLQGKRLIEYVVEALEESSLGEIFVAVTENVPATKAWAKDKGIKTVDTPGIGYVADMVTAIEGAGITEPVMIIMADLPLVKPEIIDQVTGIYKSRPEPALSTHTPLNLHARIGRRPDSLFNYQGQLIVPSGINILDGRNIKFEQEDHHLILDRIELAVNVNTAEDLRLCELILKGEIK